MSLSSVFTIWKKEFKSYFNTLLAYVCLGTFLMFMGIIFGVFLFQYMQYTQQQAMSPNIQTISIEVVIEGFYNLMHVILLLILPLFTMKLFSEEGKNKTMVLLLTSPIKAIDLVLGKFLGAFSLYSLMLLSTLIFPLFLSFFAAEGTNIGLDWSVVASTYLGIYIVGACYIAVGLFWSSITDNQFVAVTLTLLCNLGIYFIPGSDGYTSESLALLSHFSLNEHFSGFLKGIFDVKALVYFFSFFLFWMLLSYKSIQSRHWRS